MNTRVRIIFTGLAALCASGFTARATACSQCLCGSPTPPGYLLSDLTGHFSYGLEDRYLSKTNVLDDAPGNEHQIEHRISGLLMYRPMSRVALQARLPYTVKTNTRAAIGSPEEITRSHGLGDADVLGRFDLWRFGNLFSRRGTVAVIAAVTAPTGSNDAKDASGRRLDAHLQPGTGAWSGSTGLATDASFPSAAVSASVLGRANSTNAHGYHYGNVILFNLGYARTLSPTWEAALELNGRAATRDRTEDGTDDPNSGGRLLYAAPSVRWSGLGPIALDLLVQIPFVQDLNGAQTEKTTGRLSLMWAPR